MNKKEIEQCRDIGFDCIDKSFSNKKKKESMKNYWNTVVDELISTKRLFDLKIMIVVIENLITNKDFKDIYDMCSPTINSLNPIKNNYKSAVKYSIPEIIKELSSFNPRAALFGDYWRLKANYNKKIPNNYYNEETAKKIINITADHITFLLKTNQPKDILEYYKATILPYEKIIFPALEKTTKKGSYKAIKFKNYFYNNYLEKEGIPMNLININDAKNNKSNNTMELIDNLIKEKKLDDAYEIIIILNHLNKSKNLETAYMNCLKDLNDMNTIQDLAYNLGSVNKKALVFEKYCFYRSKENKNDTINWWNDRVLLKNVKETSEDMQFFLEQDNTIEDIYECYNISKLPYKEVILPVLNIVSCYCGNKGIQLQQHFINNPIDDKSLKPNILKLKK